MARGTALWERLVGKPHGKASRESHRSLDPREGKRDTSPTAREESARASPLSRRGLTPLGRLQKYPKIHVSTGEETSCSGNDSTQGLRPRHRRERNPERPPSNSHGDWLFLRPPERVHEVAVERREHLPQLEKIQKFLPSRRDEAHFRRGISRLMTPNLWNFQRDLHTLTATQEVPRHTRLHSRGSTRVPPTSRGAPFPSPSSRGGIHSLRGRERIPGVPSHFRRRRSPQESERNSRVVAPFAESPRCLSPFQGILFSLHCLDFQAEDRLTPRWHVGQPCGKASWESLVGKPRGKASRESHRSLDPREGKRDTAATAREDSACACPHSGRGLTPLGRLQKYTKVHVSPGEESSGSCTDSTQGLSPRHRRERNPERLPSNSHGDRPFLRPPEGVPVFPVVSREHLPKLEKIQEVVPSRRDEAHFH